MGKKKDPNEVAFNKRMREIACLRKKALKTFKNNPVASRAADEMFDLAERLCKLARFLWKPMINDDGDKIFIYTDVARALNPKHRQLLVRQHKVMEAYMDILSERIALFTDGVK